MRVNSVIMLGKNIPQIITIIMGIKKVVKKFRRVATAPDPRVDDQKVDWELKIIELDVNTIAEI